MIEIALTLLMAWAMWSTWRHVLDIRRERKRWAFEQQVKARAHANNYEVTNIIWKDDTHLTVELRSTEGR